MSFCIFIVFIVFNVFSSHSRGVHVYLAPLNLLQIQSFKDTNTFFVSLLVSISFVFLHFHCFHCFPKSQSRCPSAREYKFAYLQNKAAVALVRKKQKTIQKLYKYDTNIKTINNLQNKTVAVSVRENQLCPNHNRDKLFPDPPLFHKDLLKRFSSCQITLLHYNGRGA